MTSDIQAGVERQRLDAVRRYDILDTPPDAAFDRITRIAARLFDVPIAIVSIVDEDRIWFKSHHGLDLDQIPREPGLCASAIVGGEPWVVTDASIDPRTFVNPLVASEFGLRFYAGVPLRTLDGYNLGMLCVIDHAPRQITDLEMFQLKDLAGVVVDELELRLSARREVIAKDDMFAELHHRIRNNLQIVSSLLRLQSRTVDESLRLPLQDSLQRIEAIALLHEKFYAKHGSDSLELSSYLTNLGDLIIQTYGTKDKIRLVLDVAPIHLTMDRAMPLSLLLTEVISNAFKHAFPLGRAGTVFVRLQEGETDLTVSVCDDGVGSAMAVGPSEGMGRRLIGAFARQLKGQFSFDMTEKGTIFLLQMPKLGESPHGVFRFSSQR